MARTDDGYYFEGVFGSTYGNDPGTYWAALGSHWWMLADQQNTVRDEFGSSTNIQHVAYDAFGNMVAPTSASTINNISVGYTGLWWDADLGWWHSRTRWLDSFTGRWTQEDPEEFIDGPNLYPYVHNSPVNYRDPSGLRAEEASQQDLDTLRKAGSMTVDPMLAKSNPSPNGTCSQVGIYIAKGPVLTKQISSELVAMIPDGPPDPWGGAGWIGGTMFLNTYHRYQRWDVYVKWMCIPTKLFRVEVCYGDTGPGSPGSTVVYLPLQDTSDPYGYLQYLGSVDIDLGTYSKYEYNTSVKPKILNEPPDPIGP
jgi:RHS repeat-associated protein